MVLDNIDNYNQDNEEHPTLIRFMIDKTVEAIGKEFSTVENELVEHAVKWIFDSDNIEVVDENITLEETFEKAIPRYLKLIEDCPDFDHINKVDVDASPEEYTEKLCRYKRHVELSFSTVAAIIKLIFE